MFLYELCMIFLGMIISTIFQDSINQIWIKIQRFFRRFLGKRKRVISNAQNVIIGNRTTSVILIDGDGRNALENENLSVRVQRVPFEVPEDVAAIRKKTVAMLEARKSRGEDVPWNGSQLSLCRYFVSRTADTEDNQLRLYLGKTDYYTVYSTIHNLDSGDPSLRSKYIDTFEFDNNKPYPLPNGIGVCVCIITEDEKMIFATRSNSTAFRPGQSDVSAVEGFKMGDVARNQTVDVLGVCKRAIREEIAKLDENGERKELDEKEIESINILGLAFDKEYNQWNFIGCVRLNLEEHEVICHRNISAIDKWELKSLDFVSFKPADIFKYIAAHPNMWDMGVVAAYTALLFDGHSMEKLERISKKYLR